MKCRLMWHFIWVFTVCGSTCRMKRVKAKSWLFKIDNSRKILIYHNSSHWTLHVKLSLQRKTELIVFLFCLFCHSHQLFNHVRTGLPLMNQYKQIMCLAKGHTYCVVCCLSGCCAITLAKESYSAMYKIFFLLCLLGNFACFFAIFYYAVIRAGALWQML